MSRIGNKILIGCRRKPMGVFRPPNFADVVQWLKGNSITIDTETLWKDSANKGMAGDPQQGVSLTFTGTQDLDFGIGMAGETITYFNGIIESTFVLDGSGKLTGFSGTIGYMYQKSGATFLHSWPVCDWKWDSTSYPSVLSDQLRQGSEVDVQIQNATLSDVWGIHNGCRNSINLEGGSIIADINYPRQIDENGNLLPADITGGICQYTGIVPKHAEKTESNCWKANDSGYIDVGLVAGGDLQNIEFNFECDIPVAGAYNDIISWNVKVATSGILLTLTSANKFTLYIYNGTGTFIVSQDWSAKEEEIIKCSVKYTENGVAINTDLFGLSTGIYQTITYPDITRSTNVGKIAGFARIANSIRIWNVKVFELDSSGNYVKTLISFPLSEGGTSEKVHSTTSSVVGTITDGDLDPASPNYSYGKQPNYHYNLENDFDLYSDDADPTNKAKWIRQPIGKPTQVGYTLIGTRVAGNWHNQAETGELNPICPELYIPDSQHGTPLMFNGDPVNTVAQPIFYDDMVADYEYKHLIFWDIFSIAPYKKNKVVYGSPQDNPLLADTLRYVNANEVLQDKNGVNLLTDTGEQIYVLKGGVK